MKKGFLKKLSVCAISAATVISAASCGFIGGGQDDLSTALSNLSSFIDSEFSSAVSQTTGVIQNEEAVPISVKIEKKHVYQSASGNSRDDYIEGYCPALSPVEFEFNESGASLWKPLRDYAYLNSALDERNMTIQNLFNTRLSALMDTIKENGLKNQKDALGNTVNFYVKDDAYIVRADSRLFSVCDITKVVLEPAPPSIFIDTATYDSATGKELSLRDIVLDEEDFAEAVLEKLYHYYPDSDQHLLYTKKEVYDMICQRMDSASSDPLPFTVSNIGVTLYFAQGEISDQGYETVSVCVPFSEYKGLFNADLISVSSDYFSMPVPGGTFYEEDGKVRMMECEEYQGANWSTVTNIYIGDDVTMFEEDPAYSADDGGAYGADFYLLHKDGKNYVFADNYYDNDYRLADTYTVSGDSVKKGRNPEDYSAPSFRNVFPGWTEGFVMERRMDVMRTATVANSFTINEKGLLTAGHSLFHYDMTGADDVGTDTDPSYVSEYTHSYVTTKVDVPVKKVNSIDDPIEKGIDIIVPAGHKLQLIATDMKTYAACSIMDDNTLVLVPVNPEPGQEGMPMYTGSLLLTDAFEGVFWAG